MSAGEQFRIVNLQVSDWGTFSGVHDIPISERGFLFVGRSGSGKTTLLDAFSALLVPPKWVDFNAAAREGERTGRDRSLVSYVRGAWAEQEQEDSGLIATQYLRPGSTWSALALTYRNGAGEVIVLVQLFWIRGKSNSREDMKRHFFIFDRDFDLREFSDFQLDIRRLKQQFPKVFSREEFASYAERFCRRLGIDNELALKLLHKTQSAKNLGDLNTFLRDFMLDKPDTFAAAQQLVSEFAELNAAHQAVITAREQVRTLAPAREEYRALQGVITSQTELREIAAGLDGYKNTVRAGLLLKREDELELTLGRLRAEEQSAQTLHDQNRDALDDLHRQHRSEGGQQIEDLVKERGRVDALRTARLQTRGKANAECGKLGRTLPATPSEFADLKTAATREVQAWPDWQEKSGDTHAKLAGRKANFERDLASAVEEVQSLRRQPSNLPANILRVRTEIAGKLGIAETALPFAAELIEVLPQEDPWQGAIERVLRGLALSLLVEERFYTGVSEVVERANVGDRLLYNRVARDHASPVRNLQPNSLFRKVKIKEGTFSAYLQNTLIQRFDYACVDSLQAFRAAERAITRSGQVRHGKERHEKDDRFDLNDRLRWILGFDNQAKLMLFQQRAQEAAGQMEECNREIRVLKQSIQQRSDRVLACQTFINMEWQDLDTASLDERLSAIDTLTEKLREGNAVLKELDRQIAAKDKLVRKSEQALIDVKAQAGATKKDLQTVRSRCEQLRTALQPVKTTDFQNEQISKRFKLLDPALTLDNLDDLAHKLERNLNAEDKLLAATHNTLTNSIEKHFADFGRTWPLDAADLDSTLASAPDYFSKLQRLETDRLPDYEQRFFDLLRNQSHQNLAALATHLRQARQTIYDRLEDVNQSLSQAEFGNGTYLIIEASDRNLDEVREFKLQIQNALSNAWTDNREQAEERFMVLRSLVEALASEETERKRWRTQVLDVRYHVEFIGREVDREGRQVEVYRSGAGKSGGQRQKLATTCLAAALKYQLGGDDHGIPRYAPVILDEAFDKADNEFTALAMKIFEKFGFQMIVATPLKSVMTLEPFIGGACFVDIADRRRSSVLLIDYDLEHQRLDLPELSRAEFSAAIS